jgi:hypothetical protein
MYKWFFGFITLYYLGDPALSYMASLGELREVVVALILALIIQPWVVEQIEN